MNRTKTEFEVLKAYHGDCILIKTFNENHQEFIILIDGGTASTFDFSLKKELKKISKIDLLVLTHIDSDHIGGLIKFFMNSMLESIEISNIWVNTPELIDVQSGGNISFNQAETLNRLIKEKKLDTNININSDLEIFNYNNIIQIISPTQQVLQKLFQDWQKRKLGTKSTESNSEISAVIETDSYHKSLEELNRNDFKPNKSINADIINSSSISFILTCPDAKLLLLADSRPEIICNKLMNLGYNKNNKLKVDYVKISHHGSKNNTSTELLNLIDCNNYIISTNGGSSSHKHPSRETIAKIVHNEDRDFNIKRFIYLNYSLQSIKERIGDFVQDRDFNNGNWEIISQNKFKL